MLNRTNRTLSANLNRLYLGTRSLVLNAGETNGKTTLRARHAHAYADFARVGMDWSHDPSAIRIRPMERISVIPCSSPAGPWSVPGRVAGPVTVEPQVTVMPSPVPSPVRAIHATGQDGRTRSQSQQQPWPACAAGQVKRERSLECVKRLRGDQGLRPGHARARAARTAAAFAAAGG
jgi:hypothetical protein